MAHVHYMDALVGFEADLDAPMSYIGLRVLLLLDSGGATRDNVDLDTAAGGYRNRISHGHTRDIRPDEAMELSRQRGGRYADHVREWLHDVVGMFSPQQG